MSAREALGRIVGLLDGAGIPYMLSGSFAGTFHGTPRSTMDFDLIVDPTPESLRTFLDSLDPDEHYADRRAAEKAFRSRGQFNVVDARRGWKADLILRKDRPFSREEFRRRIRAEVLGLPVWLSTAEDTILAKLEWAKKGGSERQARDVEGIVATSGARLDLEYLDEWAGRLRLAREWRRLRRTIRAPGSEEE